MAIQLRTVQFCIDDLVHWAREQVASAPHHVLVPPLPEPSESRCLDYYWAWVMNRGWTLVAVVAVGPLAGLERWAAVWSGEDTTGSPDPWENE
jgi:hypothetical protein